MAYKDFQSQIDKLFDEIVTLENRLVEAEATIKRLEATVHNQKVAPTRGPVKVPYVGGKVFDHEFERLEGRIPPEKKPELQASKNRIKAAVDMFTKNFDIHGNPTSELGKTLSKRYSED